LTETRECCIADVAFSTEARISLPSLSRPAGLRVYVPARKVAQVEICRFIIIVRIRVSNTSAFNQEERYEIRKLLTCVTFLAEGLYIMHQTSSPRRTSRLQVKDIEREVENFCLKKPDLNELQIRIAILLLISNVVEVTNGLSMRGKKLWNPPDFLSFQLT